MKEQTWEHPKILAAAERQMQTWVRTQEIAERTIAVHGPHGTPGSVGPYITLSRETGAGGGEIAAIVGCKLGWEVLDNNILDYVAERYRLLRSMLELVDETTSNWAFDIFGAWFDHKVVSHEKYLVHLNRVVLAAARRGNVVIVGRGANFLLPRSQGLAVRIVASERYRIEQVMRRHKLTETEARKFIAEIDRGRREFVLRFFHHDVTDPRLFDLVINTDPLGPQAAADAIVETYRCWSRNHPTRSPERAAMPTRTMRETVASTL